MSWPNDKDAYKIKRDGRIGSGGNGTVYKVEKNNIRIFIKTSTFLVLGNLGSKQMCN